MGSHIHRFIILVDLLTSIHLGLEGEAQQQVTIVSSPFACVHIVLRPIMANVIG